MKCNIFPDDYSFKSQIVFRDKFLFLLTKIVSSFNNKIYHTTLFDPLEDKFFGHTCKYNPIVNVYDDYRMVQLHIGLNEETPLLFHLNGFQQNEPNLYNMYFNPLDGQYIKSQDTRYLRNITNEFPYYYENNFLAYFAKDSIHYYDSWEKVIDVDIRQQVANLEFVGKIEKNYIIIIIQPKINNKPKILQLDFNATNVYKHPTEPLLIVYSGKQYAVIDLDI